jgi:hypothetical protein
MAEPVYKDSVPIPDKIGTEKDVPPNMPGSGIRVEKEPKPMPKPVKKMAKGGSASSRADGIAQRGKTRGTMVMCGGGMAKGKR